MPEDDEIGLRLLGLARDQRLQVPPLLRTSAVALITPACSARRLGMAQHRFAALAHDAAQVAGGGRPAPSPSKARSSTTFIQMRQPGTDGAGEPDRLVQACGRCRAAVDGNE